MHAITERSAEEACRIRTSRLSIALTSTIFLRGYLSRRFIGDGAEGERESTPEVWLLPTDEEPRLLARKTRLVSARLLRAPLHCLSCRPALLTRTRCFGSIGEIYSAAERPGPDARCHTCWLDVSETAHRLRRSSYAAPYENASVRHEDIVHRSYRHNIVSSKLSRIPWHHS